MKQGLIQPFSLPFDGSKIGKKLKEKIMQILLPLTVVKHFEFGANQRFRTENGSKIEQ